MFNKQGSRGQFNARKSENYKTVHLFLISIHIQPFKSMYEIKESDDSAFLAKLCESHAIGMLIARVTKNGFYLLR